MNRKFFAGAAAAHAPPAAPRLTPSPASARATIPALAPLSARSPAPRLARSLAATTAATPLLAPASAR